jgi:hypothetical protein
VAVAALLMTAACSDGGDGSSDGRAAPTPDVLVAAEDPVALAPLPDGGLRYGERLTGRVLEVDAAGDDPAQVATVEVATDGQRGLVGLAVDDQDRTFASWVRPDGRLVVGQVAPGPERPVWIGPVTEDRANGGRIELLPDGSLVVGIGDLLDPDAVGDPTTPNGKLLVLDPEGPPDQGPEVLSGGWNNPFAFDVGPGGAVWVADNEPGSSEERLTRGDVERAVTLLPEQTAPSGLVVVDADTLLVCGYVSGELTRWEVDEDGSARLDGALADDCRLGVTRLSDGRVVYATEEALRVLPPRSVD